MPEFYGSQRLFWYLIVAVTLNSASIAVLTYFLVERAKAGSTAVYHFLGLFERCLPAWWKERRLEAERQSIAQLVTSAIALSYLLHSLTLISGPALFDDGDPSVRKGGVTSTWPCSLAGAARAVRRARIRYLICIYLSRSSSRRLCDELWSGDEA